jgi:hypothetical protein
MSESATFLAGTFFAAAFAAGAAGTDAASGACAEAAAFLADTFFAAVRTAFLAGAADLAAADDFLATSTRGSSSHHGCRPTQPTTALRRVSSYSK